MPPASIIGSYIQPARVVTLSVNWVYGDSDRIIPASYSRYDHIDQRTGAKPALTLAERWRQNLLNAGLVVYPTVGHIPMEKLPEDMARDAAFFLCQGLEASVAAMPAEYLNQNGPAHDPGEYPRLVNG